MIEAVHSGGQTGTDQGALMAAKELGITTGGWAPKGYKTELGFERELLEGFGLKEGPDYSYYWRTFENIKDTDVTIVLSVKQKSSGTAMTMSGAIRYKKPRILIVPSDPGAKAELLSFLRKHKPSVINVAGNRESVAPGITNLVKEFLLDVLKEYNTPEVVASESV